MDNNNIRIVGFDKTADADFGKIVYIDDGIAIYTDIRFFPIEDSTVRMDMITCVACISGRLRAEVNTQEYTIREHEIMFGKPNDMITNVMVSPDFNGIVLCVSQKYMMEQIAMNDIWNHAFQIFKKPVMHIDEEQLNIYILYENLLKAKIEQTPIPFQKVIITSIIKAMLYELLSNAISANENIPNNMQLEKAGDTLFKRFIELLSGSTVKPRSVAWYADRLCVTPKYLSTACKQATGKTALQWINEYVEMDICHWLKNSDKTIKEIADLLDFPNISFFGKYCRKHFGLSPMALRQKLREDR